MTVRYYRDAEGNFLGGFQGVDPIGGIRVPSAPDHVDQKWVNGAWTAPPKTFKRLKPINFELGMLSLDVTPDQVTTVIESLPEPDRTIAKIYWTRATGFERADPLIDEIAAIFNKTEAEIERAWRYAESFED